MTHPRTALCRIRSRSRLPRKMAMSLYKAYGEDPIHETEDFAVFVDTLRPASKDEITHSGYLLVNKRTKVVEAQGTLEYNAITAMRNLQTELDAALEGKEAADAGEADFDEVLRRLRQRGIVPETGE